MTVEKAYYQLASEGYIIRRTKARYEVADIAFPQKKERPVYRQQEKQETLPPVVYDFGSGDMDMERFPMAVWRKLMSRVLSEPAYLLANQDEQGAPVLRQALSEYVYQSRGVHADPESILIGSGTIPLLAVLTSLLQPDFERIAVEEPGFRLGRELFRSRGFSLQPVPVRDGLLDMDILKQSGARLVGVSPSHQFPTGTVMPAGMRYDLLHWAGDYDGMIVEDDYDSELRYYGRPVPALQGMDKAGRVIYMGALSKVLPLCGASVMAHPSAATSYAVQGKPRFIPSGVFCAGTVCPGRIYPQRGTARSGVCAKTIRKRESSWSGSVESLFATHPRQPHRIRRLLPHYPEKPGYGGTVIEKGSRKRLPCLIGTIVL